MMHKRRTILAICLGIICITPVLLLFGLSISQNWVFPSLLPQHTSLQPWAELVQGNRVTDSLGVSIIISLATAVLATTSGFVASRVIAYDSRRRLLLFLAYLPFVMSPVILAVCLKFYFIKMGLAGTIAGVVLAQMIICFPYTTIFFMSFWNQRTSQYIHLVSTLGGGEATAFARVLLPLARPLLLVCFFQTFLISWFEYGLTSVIGYGKVQTLTIMVYQFITEANLFYAALSCCLLILPPVALLWLNKKFIFRAT